jgi:putative CocE/NonD family hydrolase
MRETGLKRQLRLAYADVLWWLLRLASFLEKHLLLPFMRIPSSTPDQFARHVVEKDVPIPMRDGVRLYADIYKPPATGKFPVVLIRLPYGKGEYYTYMPAYGRFWPKKGYVCLIQDVRGKWASEGDFQALANEIEDGYDTLEWIARQPWCDGNIGMMGESYYGHTQWAAAVSRHPNLKCIAPMDIDVDSYRLNYTGGAFNLQLIGGWMAGQDTKTVRNALRLDYWHLPLIDMADDAGLGTEIFRETMRHPTRDAYWGERSLHTQIDQIQIPILHIGGWYDTFTRGTLDAWRRMRESALDPAAREKQWLLMAPIDHEHSPERTNQIGRLRLGGEWDAAWLFDRHEQFFDRFLRGMDNGWDARPPVEIFVIGADKWRFEEEWPPAGAEETRLYLHSHTSANTRSGDGWLDTAPPEQEAPDEYVYDPLNPVDYSLGVDYWYLAKSMKDRGPAEDRPDVLVYSSEPLAAETEITGPITATLYAASSAQDTDFTAALVDVFPDGHGHLIQEGIVRARFRDSDREPSLIEPGEIYEYSIDLWATSYVLRAGHRMRVEISSSNFNRFDRNLNTGGPLGQEDAPRVARQKIYHDRERASFISLPLLARWPERAPSRSSEA